MFRIREGFSFKDYTLVIPSTSVGNVAQLTADLIIENLKLRKAGSVYDDAIIPIAGPPAFEHDTDTITMACELYTGDSERKLAVLHIRSPLVAALIDQFFAKLLDFIKTQGFARVILLSSSFSYEKHRVEGAQFEYKATEGLKSEAEAFNWTAASKPTIPGGGFAGKLFKQLEEKEIPTILLYKYVSEGDNIPDAVELFGQANRLLHFVSTEDASATLNLSYPISWTHLYGNGPPAEIY